MAEGGGNDNAGWEVSVISNNHCLLVEGGGGSEVTVISNNNFLLVGGSCGGAVWEATIISNCHVLLVVEVDGISAAMLFGGQQTSSATLLSGP